MVKQWSKYKVVEWYAGIKPDLFNTSEAVLGRSVI